MPEVKGYVKYVGADGELDARVIAKREHNVMEGDKEVPVVILDLKIMNPETGTVVEKGCVQGTEPGCWHE